MAVNLLKIGQQTGRVERHWIGGKKADLPVFRLPLENLYFNIENGRYADRMIRLRQENPGRQIDPRKDEWKEKIEQMLAGEHADTSRDKAAFAKLLEDIEARDQLRPGVVLQDGGVLDGNRRLAALRRLWKKSKNTERFRHFEAVILPDNTTAEDRWRIEAGLQLGINERWDYSPINELLKIRQGLQMYEEMISDGRSPAKNSAVTLVAKAIYGKAETDIEEMDSRLKLIDDYLDFIEQSGAYDRVGQSSEDFLEASRITRAAANRQLDPKFIAKLKAVLFYVIDRNLMDNWELRSIYHALGGDPRKRGRKPPGPNMDALQELLDKYPEVREIREDLRSLHNPSLPTAARRPTAKHATAAKAEKSRRRAKSTGGERKVDSAKAEAATEVFKRKMELSGKKHAVRKMAEGAAAGLQALEAELRTASTVRNLSVEDRAIVLESLDAISASVATCRKLLKAS